MNHEQRRQLALWRYSVLGPLVSARLGYGDRREHFHSAARRIYERPCGRKVQLSPRTIEDWYYALAPTRQRRSDGFLHRSGRYPVGTLVLGQYREFCRCPPSAEKDTIITR